MPVLLEDILLIQAPLKQKKIQSAMAFSRGEEI